MNLFQKFLFMLLPLVTVGLSIIKQEYLPRWETNSAATGRDGGISCLLGKEMLWMFGDTFTCSGDFVGSSTAGWASNLYEPWKIYEQVMCLLGYCLIFIPLLVFLCFIHA
jgi:hypothetical protein